MTGDDETSHVAPVTDTEAREREKIQAVEANAQQQPPPSAQARVGAKDPMTDEERERRYKRLWDEEEVSPMRAILDSPWGDKLWGARFKPHGPTMLQQAREDRLRKAKEDASRRKDNDPPETIHGVEEQGNSTPPETIQREEEKKGKSPRPEPEREKIHGEEEQRKFPPHGGEMAWLREILDSPHGAQFWGVRQKGLLQQGMEETSRRRKEKEEANSSKPPPSRGPSEQAEDRVIPSSWVAAIPTKRDKPVTWITDEYGDPEAPQYLDDMAEFYLEAARRLPIAQMPRLAGFLSWGGLLLGVNDPVTNIIVNAIYLMGSFRHSDVLPRGTDAVQHAADRASYVDNAFRSRASLVSFMVFYFRHLTEDQAKRYLRAAGHDLALAIGLAEWHRKGGFGTPSEQLDDLSPECSRTKTALQYAAKAARHGGFDADDLVRLLTSRFPRHLLDPVLDDLRRGEQLSVGRVKDILNLLRNPWSPPPPVPPPTPGTFRDADGNVTIIAKIGQDLFSTTTIIQRDCVAASNSNQNSNIATTTTISRHLSLRGHENNDDLAAAAYLFTGSDTESRLRAFLNTTTAQQLQPDTKSLKMYLIDTIHGLYIQALAMLPIGHQPCLLRAVFAGGHCYGVMDDPVSNIVVNSIWYNARFPHSESNDDDDTLIKATRSMTRAESSSLHGLIAILRVDQGVTEQDAVTCLCKNRHNLMMTMTSCLNQHSLAAAAEAAKHPQPAALVAFLTTLLTSEKRDRLRCLLTAKRALSVANFKVLNTMITGNDVIPAPAQRVAMPPDLVQAFNTMTTAGWFQPGIFNFSAVSTTGQSPDLHDPCQPDMFDTVQRIAQYCRGPMSYLRLKVEEVLLSYGRNNPLGPQYKLGLICGVASMVCSAPYIGTTCYHVNFLASSSADAPNSATTAPECNLYFAEIWNQADDQFERSKKPPFCCPIQNYHAFPGRCFICESSTVWIVHPPCGNYYMGHEYNTDSLCNVAEQHADLGQ